LQESPHETRPRRRDEIKKIRVALSSRYAGLFGQMPSHQMPSHQMPSHTPCRAVAAAADAAHTADADLIGTSGGGSITDGAKAVQLCLANDIRTPEAMDALRPAKRPDGTLVSAAMGLELAV